MNDCPWIDARELEELAARYPTVPRSRIELALQAYWPVKKDVEVALLELVATQLRETSASLDFTPAS